MNRKIQLFTAICIILLASCADKEKNSHEIWKNEILETEQNFAAMAGDEGIRKAFLTYAAEDAVMMRNDKLIIGKENFHEYFGNQASEDNDQSLTWKPDFVDVADSGDLGYTYGHYTFSYTDSSGARIEKTGVFHTVWKRQADGTWRFVWD